MGKVTYLEHDGTAHSIELEEGISLMEGAISNGIPGIDGDCGGQRACATCHVFVDEAWLPMTGVASEQEDELLELAPERGTNSRLACQIAMSTAIDGIVVQMPESQH